jgi:hypothetical protein
MPLQFTMYLGAFFNLIIGLHQALEGEHQK